MTKATLKGPQGITIVLDSAEIFPDDPGQGTPAMVYVGPHSGTYWAAYDTGELICGPHDHQLTATQCNWLDEQYDTVTEFLKENGG